MPVCPGVASSTTGDDTARYATRLPIFAAPVATLVAPPIACPVPPVAPPGRCHRRRGRRTVRGRGRRPLGRGRGRPPRPPRGPLAHIGPLALPAGREGRSLHLHPGGD